MSLACHDEPAGLPSRSYIPLVHQTSPRGPFHVSVNFIIPSLRACIAPRLIGGRFCCRLQTHKDVKGAEVCPAGLAFAMKLGVQPTLARRRPPRKNKARKLFFGQGPHIPMTLSYPSPPDLTHQPDNVPRSPRSGGPKSGFVGLGALDHGIRLIVPVLCRTSLLLWATPVRGCSRG